MDYIYYYDISAEGYFIGTFSITLQVIFVVIAINLLIFRNEIAEREVKKGLIKKFIIAWSTFALLIGGSWIYSNVKSKYETGKLLEDPSKTNIVIGEITNHKTLRKETGDTSFEVNSIKFRTFSTFKDCEFPNCGLTNGDHVKITYVVKDSKNDHRNRILKVEILKDYFCKNVDRFLSIDNFIKQQAKCQMNANK